MTSFFRFCLMAFCFGVLALSLGLIAFERDVVHQGALAFLLAFVPMVITVGIVLKSYSTDPQMQLLVGLGTGGIRMFAVLGVALALSQIDAERFGIAFLLWLLVFYLVFLAFEIAFLVARQNPTNESKSA